MIGKIIGQSTFPMQQPLQKAANPRANFMDLLRNKFEEVTGQLKDIPGMPGVYSVNPAALTSLDITDISSMV